MAHGKVPAVGGHAMTPLTVTPVHPVLGARVEGVDLTVPLDDATFGKIHDAF